MIIKWHIRLKKTEIFCGVTWRDNVWEFLELKRRYSVLLGLADNLLASNQAKTFLMQDSIIDMVDYACSGENEIYTFEYHPHRNDNGSQSILKW